MVEQVNTTYSGLLAGLDSTSETSAPNELGKDAFLQLLVTQMTMQNPLEPMDNTEFISQLAQFSSLEQMTNISNGMQLLALTQTAATNSQMVNMIGKRIVAKGNGFTCDGSKPVDLLYEFSEEVDAAWLIIKDSKGNVVRKIRLEELSTGKNRCRFDGKDEAGNMLAAGNYTYEIVGSDGNKLSGVQTYANYLIDAVAFEGSSILLRSDEETINLADVMEVIGG